MEMKAQQGYLALADISGFSAYLAGVELDHAHGVLTDLLELIVGSFQSVLTISKLEGDAVFAYAPSSRLARGETMIELVEATYVAFRDKVEAIRRRTTCECNACRAIPTLDLKFLIHVGDFMVQSVAGIRELVGTDVNLVHRLLKNHIGEATGWRAYLLLSEKALFQIGVPMPGQHVQTEAYDLGTVQTYTVDLHPRYKEITEARRVVVEPGEALAKHTHDYPVPPPVLWEWLNDPKKRASYAMQEVMFVPVSRPAGRTGAGAQNHCMHGKDVAMQEIILDWRPFDYFTVRQEFMGFVENITYRLTPIAGGTRLQLISNGTSPGPRFLNRPIFMIMQRMFPMSKMMAKLDQRIQEDTAREQPAQMVPSLAVG